VHDLLQSNRNLFCFISERKLSMLQLRRLLIIIQYQFEALDCELKQRQSLSVTPSPELAHKLR
jgi:hypothetical protein